MGSLLSSICRSTASAISAHKIEQPVDYVDDDNTNTNKTGNTYSPFASCQIQVEEDKPILRAEDGAEV